MQASHSIVRFVVLPILVLCGLGHGPMWAGEAGSLLKIDPASCGIPGGLVVQLGAADTQTAVELARTGRYLVQVLDSDPAAVDRARQRASDAGVLGLLSVDQTPATQSLPYTENLVNVVMVTIPVRGRTISEIQRVLCPEGVILAAPDTVPLQALKTLGLREVEVGSGSDGALAVRKPWPDEMDDWTHPRYTAAGNAVSQDTMVGPPRRVRWLAGPWQEVANLVTARGRNYYGGVWARDGFNGLRLWQHALAPSPAKGGFGFRPASGSAPPIAGAGRVFVFTDGKLQALDGRTGRVVAQYAEAGRPQHVLFDEGVLIAVESNQLHCIDAESGRVLWTHLASQPRHVVAGDGMVGLVQGDPRRGETSEVVVLDQRSGKVKWSRNNFQWAARASRSVYHQGMFAFEVSSMNNDGPNNALYVVSAVDGAVVRDIEFLPGMNHVRQARAMFVEDRLWLLQGGRDADNKRQPVQATAIDLQTGETIAKHPAGLAHCFPPVATTRYMLSGEMDLTDLQTGEIDANQITKAACGRDAGWFPAHGLIYVTPKHCVCWPMLRGYAALAPARAGGNPALEDVGKIDFVLQQGVEKPGSNPPQTADDDWSCYRHDAWRSGSTEGDGPPNLSALWTTSLGDMRNVAGPILTDWEEDPFCKGPVTPPVIANGVLYVARPHAHQVVALDAVTGKQRWRFTASGRVDTPPTIYQGLCLFGARSGWVYCLRADDGQLVWRMRAAPMDEQIVTYGQLESPWPIPGSVLIVDDVAYFAAGRQSFADGGIFVFAVDPATGTQHWVRRLDSIPQTGFYTSSGLEFDNFDLLFREGDRVAMSRWLFDRATGDMSVELWKAFAQLNTGHGSVMAPQGCWSYAPRNQSRTKTFSPRRPLVVYRDNVLFGCLENKQSVYRRDFDLEGGEKFETKWITGWAGSDASRNDGTAWRSQRLAEKATWTVQIHPTDPHGPTLDAIVLAGKKLFLASSSGDLQVVSAERGELLGKQQVAAVVWDGMAVANNRLYLSAQDGRVFCLGARTE